MSILIFQTVQTIGLFHSQESTLLLRLLQVMIMVFVFTIYLSPHYHTIRFNQWMKGSTRLGGVFATKSELLGQIIPIYLYLTVYTILRICFTRTMRVIRNIRVFTAVYLVGFAWNCNVVLSGFCHPVVTLHLRGYPSNTSKDQLLKLLRYYGSVYGVQMLENEALCDVNCLSGKTINPS